MPQPQQIADYDATKRPVRFHIDPTPANVAVALSVAIVGPDWHHHASRRSMCWQILADARRLGRIGGAA